ncbi:LysR family transcriptional regulator [Amycolatopsis sp. NPDC050768]|uniref:LysR family transcriptional regulator n=1 Tax=Amycolatopsis sp. NPDC050768 TaxID=3154839 RepID=UPI0033E0A44A
MEYLIAVAETGSFSRAAESLNVSQPGLSQQIKQLEREIGAVLVERLPRLACLTPAGRAFLPDARRAVTAARQAKRAAVATDTGSGDLEIATVLSVAAGVLPASVAEWNKRAPGATIRLFEYTHADRLAKDVANGVADLAVGPTPVGWEGPVVPLGAEEFVVVLPPHDPVAEHGGVIDLEMLADRSWVLFDRQNGLSDIVEGLCRAAGFVPRGVLHTTQISAGVRLAAAGLGPMIIPDNVVPPELRAPVMRLRKPFRRPLSVYARMTFSPLAQGYVDVLRNTPLRLTK